MKEQRFGIEIEMTGLTKKNAAEILGSYFGKIPFYSGGTYGTWLVNDGKDRLWKIMNDASIRVENGEAVELVSPICKYEDLETIQEIVRLLRKNGGKANSSCGIHIHIDASIHTAKSIKNITNIMASKEDLIFRALQVNANRAQMYCKKADEDFIDELNRRKPQSLSEVKRLWYKGGDGSREHYHYSRYHALNLHSVFSKGTIEFRCFNGSLHAGKIKAYIQFCLAISNQALTQKKASRQKTATTNDKYTFRTWLLRLGLIGEEFKTARYHLLSNLEGNIAWRAA